MYVSSIHWILNLEGRQRLGRLNTHSTSNYVPGEFILRVSYFLTRTIIDWKKKNLAELAFVQNSCKTDNRSTFPEIFLNLFKIVSNNNILHVHFTEGDNIFTYQQKPP